MRALAKLGAFINWIFGFNPVPELPVETQRSTLYEASRDRLFTGSLDWDDDLKIVLVDEAQEDEPPPGVARVRTGGMPVEFDEEDTGVFQRSAR